MHAYMHARMWLDWNLWDSRTESVEIKSSGNGAIHKISRALAAGSLPMANEQRISLEQCQTETACSLQEMSGANNIRRKQNGTNQWAPPDGDFKLIYYSNQTERCAIVCHLWSSGEANLCYDWLLSNIIHVIDEVAPVSRVLIGANASTFLGDEQCVIFCWCLDKMFTRQCSLSSLNECLIHRFEFD